MLVATTKAVAKSRYFRTQVPRVVSIDRFQCGCIEQRRPWHPFFRTHIRTTVLRLNTRNDIMGISAQDGLMTYFGHDDIPWEERARGSRRKIISLTDEKYVAIVQWDAGWTNKNIGRVCRVRYARVLAADRIGRSSQRRRDCLCD